MFAVCHVFLLSEFSLVMSHTFSLRFCGVQPPPFLRCPSPLIRLRRHAKRSSGRRLGSRRGGRSGRGAGSRGGGRGAGGRLRQRLGAVQIRSEVALAERAALQRHAAHHLDGLTAFGALVDPRAGGCIGRSETHRKPLFLLFLRIALSPRETERERSRAECRPCPKPNRCDVQMPRRGMAEAFGERDLVQQPHQSPRRPETTRDALPTFCSTSIRSLRKDASNRQDVFPGKALARRD